MSPTNYPESCRYEMYMEYARTSFCVSGATAPLRACGVDGAMLFVVSDIPPPVLVGLARNTADAISTVLSQ
jgi:hypothetical protein